MDVIAGARTHVYMAPSTVQSALEIVLGVLAQFLGGKALEKTWKGLLLIIKPCNHTSDRKVKII